MSDSKYTSWKYSHVRFKNNDEDFTFKEFFDNFQYNLPQLVEVTIGHYGLTNIDTFAAEQIIRIHDTFTQKRAVAHTRRHTKISIPVEYPLKFKVVEGRNKVGPEQYLSEILKERSFPFQIQFAPTNRKFRTIDGISEDISFFGNMAVSELHDELYLLGNCVNMGRVEEKISVIPIYLAEVQLSTISGFDERTRDNYQEFMDYVDGVIKTCRKDNLKGNEEITMYHEEENVYDYIAVSTFQSYEDDKPIRETSEPLDKSENYYEPWSTVRESTRRQMPKLPKLPPRHTDVPHPGKRSLSDPGEATDSITIYKRTTGQVPSLPPRKTSLDKEQTVKDIVVANLTIAELGQRLKDLKLGKYVKAFEKQRVDGPTLIGLEKEELKKQFHFDPTEAVRLVNFARTGHIPH